MTARVPDTRVTSEPSTSLYIVGFAPSWSETPWTTEGAEFWGMNSLHKVAADGPWTAWFQLHDIDRHHPDDKAEHIAWLIDSKIPVFMWEKHIEKYRIPNAVPYPLKDIVAKFGTYFNNTVSWELALAILIGEYKKISVYGVDMATASEYGHQRPSCEYFLGWARGAGIEIEIPDSADLLKSPYLYGLHDEELTALQKKMRARVEGLKVDLARHEGIRNDAQAVSLQLRGAIEDSEYYLNTWAQEASNGR